VSIGSTVPPRKTMPGLFTSDSFVTSRALRTIVRSAVDGVERPPSPRRCQARRHMILGRPRVAWPCRRQAGRL
jgi:hypothetical protein